MGSIGIDIVDIRRIKEAVKRPGFMRRCFTPRERGADVRTLAGYFAAKEAVAKAMGTGFRGFWPSDIEILRDDRGKPYADGFDVSISHEKDFAVAVAVPVADKPFDADMAALSPLRPKRSNKGTFGTLAAFVGSDSMTGAAFLCAKAAYKVGAGMVRVLSTPNVANVLRNNLFEAVVTETASLNVAALDDFSEVFGKCTAGVVGCGIGNNDETRRFMERLIDICPFPLVIDADGLNAISQNPSVLKQLNRRAIITPHLLEMSRLTGLSVAHISDDIEQTATDFAKTFGVTVVLKDAETAVADPSGDVWRNKDASTSLAKAGTGDVLAGVIAGLSAQGATPWDAARLGVYMHGRAGRLAAAVLGERSVLASELYNFF